VRYQELQAQAAVYAEDMLCTQYDPVSAQAPAPFCLRPLQKPLPQERAAVYDLGGVSTTA